LYIFLQITNVGEGILSTACIVFQHSYIINVNQMLIKMCVTCCIMFFLHIQIQNTGRKKI